MPRGYQHPPELRAAVLAELAAGSSAAEAGRNHGVSASRIREWARAAAPIVSVGPKKREALGELLEHFVREVLGTLSAHARFVRDEAWLRQQNAHDLAILDGVLVDKTISILAAAERAQGPEPGALDVPGGDD